MRKKIIEALLKFKSAYMAHLAASITVTAIAGVVAVGSVCYGVYSLSQPEETPAVVAETSAPAKATKTETASTEATPVKTKTATAEKSKTSKEETKMTSTKEAEKAEKEETSKSDSKASAKTEAKAETKTQTTSAAESKKEASSQKSTSSQASAPAKAEEKASAPAASEAPKAKEKTYTVIHHEAVTMPVYEMKYVVDVPAHQEPVTTTYTVTDYNTEAMIVDGGYCPAGSVVVGSHEVTETYMSDVPEQGHMEKVQVGTQILEPAYDEYVEN